jgi:hypothetical protein
MAEAEDVLTLLLLTRIKNRNKFKKPRREGRWWVRPVNLNREKKGEFRRLIIELRLHDTEGFFTYTRMTPSLFEELVRLVSPMLTKTSIRKALCPSQRLAITLRYIAQQNLSIHIYVYFSNQTKKFKEIAKEFQRIWNMPLCVGSIDGKHIRIIAPENSGSLYYNYKNYFSLVLLGVCDANYNFIYVDVGAYGSNSDGAVFGSSRYDTWLELPLTDEN